MLVVKDGCVRSFVFLHPEFVSGSIASEKVASDTFPCEMYGDYIVFGFFESNFVFFNCWFSVEFLFGIPFHPDGESINEAAFGNIVIDSKLQEDLLSHIHLDVVELGLSKTGFSFFNSNFLIFVGITYFEKFSTLGSIFASGVSHVLASNVGDLGSIPIECSSISVITSVAIISDVAAVIGISVVAFITIRSFVAAILEISLVSVC